MIRHFPSVIFVLAVISALPAASSSCAEYEAEAEAISGVVPRFNENGSLRSILLHGEGTFLTTKRSLINVARKKAELSAKQALSSFLNENLSAGQKANSLLEQVEATDQDGNTESMALELASVVEEMQSDTSAVMNGIVKLDECVDTDGKYILVTLGWKPDETLKKTKKVSELDTTSELDNRSVEKQTANLQLSVPQSADSECINSLKIEIVNSTGYGQSQNEAITDGIRIAVSQVFGEVVASSIQLSSSISEVQVTDSDENSEGLASETSVQTQQSASATSGVVKSYSIEAVSRSGTTFEIDLSVQLPTYCKSDSAPTKKKVVIMQPSVFAHRAWTKSGDKLAASIQIELESLLNETHGLTVLSRIDNAAVSKELSSISIDEYSIDELVKKGNKLAADYIVLTKFSDFETKRVRVKTGVNESVEMYVTKAQAWIRVVDVVTTDMVASIRVPLTSRSVSRESNLEAFSLTMAHNMASVIGERVGGGFNEQGAKLLSSSSDKVASYAAAKKMLKNARDQLKKDVQNDW